MFYIFLFFFSNKWLSQREAVDQLVLPSGPLGSCTPALVCIVRPLMPDTETVQLFLLRLCPDTA